MFIVSSIFFVFSMSNFSGSFSFELIRAFKFIFILIYGELLINFTVVFVFFRLYIDKSILESELYGLGIEIVPLSN